MPYISAEWPYLLYTFVLDVAFKMAGYLLQCGPFKAFCSTPCGVVNGLWSPYHGLGPIGLHPRLPLLEPLRGSLRIGNRKSYVATCCRHYWPPECGQKQSFELVIRSDDQYCRSDRRGDARPRFDDHQPGRPLF